MGPPLIGALMRMPVDAVLARMLADLHAAGFTDLVTCSFRGLPLPRARTAAPQTSPQRSA